MSRCSCLIDSFCSMKRCARYSSSSGLVGRSPATPKLLGVSTSPAPKCPFQMRLTMTRVATGWRRMASASSSRPLPFANGAPESPFGQHRQEVTRLFIAEVVRAAPLADLQVDRLLDVGDAVDEGVASAAAPCAASADVSAQPVHVGAAVDAQLPLQAPAAERQQPRLGTILTTPDRSRPADRAGTHRSTGCCVRPTGSLRIEPAPGTEVCRW